MSYEVRIARQARAYLRRLDRATQERIRQRLRQIAEDPTGQHTKPLTNAGGLRSSRVGSWRIVFEIDETARVVAVSDIGPRGDIYRNL